MAATTSVLFPRTRTRSPLGQLLDGVDTVMRDHRSDDERACGVADVLEPVLGDPDLLRPALRRSSPRCYRTNVLYAAPNGSFSIVALVWRPGQRTPVHSHRSWCVVGVHEGVEREVAYELVPGDQPTLQVRSSRLYRPGDVTWLSGGDGGIHSVENAGDRLAISIHVYALDYRRMGSSVLQTFAAAA